MKRIGYIKNYLKKISVGIVVLYSSDVLGEDEPLRLGDEILILGKHICVRQKVTEMQLNHKNIKTARAGEIIGIKFDKTSHYEYIEILKGMFQYRPLIARKNAQIFRIEKDDYAKMDLLKNSGDFI